MADQHDVPCEARVPGVCGDDGLDIGRGFARCAATMQSVARAAPRRSRTSAYCPCARRSRAGRRTARCRADDPSSSIHNSIIPGACRSARSSASPRRMATKGALGPLGATPSAGHPPEACRNAEEVAWTGARDGRIQQACAPRARPRAASSRASFPAEVGDRGAGRPPARASHSLPSPTMRSDGSPTTYSSASSSLPSDEAIRPAEATRTISSSCFGECQRLAQVARRLRRVHVALRLPEIQRQYLRYSARGALGQRALKMGHRAGGRAPRARLRRRLPKRRTRSTGSPDRRRLHEVRRDCCSNRMPAPARPALPWMQPCPSRRWDLQNSTSRNSQDRMLEDDPARRRSADRARAADPRRSRRLRRRSQSLRQSIAASALGSSNATASATPARDKTTKRPRRAGGMTSTTALGISDLDRTVHCPRRCL